MSELMLDMESVVDREVLGLASLSRTLKDREDMMLNFSNAFKYMEISVSLGKRMSSELYGQYSAICFGLYPDDWKDRYSHPRNISIADRHIDRFYQDLDNTGYLTLTNLAKLYDSLGISELMLDGNMRNQLLAITHVLLEEDYPVPDTTSVSKETMSLLAKSYKDPIQRNIEFLKLILPDDNIPPEN